MIISVVILTRNEEERIGSCLESILNSEDNNLFEILVVDGESQDNTVDIVKNYTEAYENVRLIQCDGYGYSLQRNIGALNANGKYILYISGDAYASKNLIKRYLEFCELEYDVVQGSIINIPNQTYFSKVMQYIYPIIYPISHQNSALETISTVNILIRRDLLIDISFDENIKSLEDKEWYFRLEQEKTIKYARCRGAVVFHNIHESFRQYTRKIYREAKAIGQIDNMNKENSMRFRCFDWANIALVNFGFSILVLLMLILNGIKVLPLKYTLFSILFVLVKLLIRAILICKRDKFKRNIKDRILMISIVYVYIIAISVGYLRGYIGNKINVKTKKKPASVA